MDWLGKLPWILQHPREGIELVQCSTAGTKTTLFLQNPRFYYRPYSPFQYPGIDLPGEAEKCDPPVVGTHPPVPLLEERDHHPDLPSQKYCPRPPHNAAEMCQPRQPHNIQRLEVLRADLIHCRCLANKEFLDYLGDFSPGDGRGHLQAPSLCFLNGRRDGGIEEILEVFLPPSDDIPSWGQQPPTSTVNSVGGALLPPPEAPDSLPESLRGQPVVLLHGLTELLPGPSFCLHNHPGCTPLSLPVPVSCLRSPTSQPGPIGLLLQLDGIPYFQCPPPGSGIAASTGTRRPYGHSSERQRRQWRWRTWSTLTQYLQPPSGSGRSSAGGGSWRSLWQGIRPNVSSRPLHYAWVCRVCPASSPAIGSNSPPGGDQLTAPPLSSPECPRHTAEGQIKRPQSRSSTYGLGCPVPLPTTVTLKSPSRTMESPVGALSSTPPRDTKKAGYSTLPFGL